MNDPGVTERALRDGDHFFQAQRYDDALTEYERAALLDSSSVAAFLKCGNTFFELGSFEDARRNYLEAVSLDPGNADAHFRLGLSFSKLNDPNSAIKELEQATAVDTTFAAAYYELGLALYLLHNHEEARLKYEKAVNFSDASATALHGKVYYSWGQTFLMEGKYEEALAKYESASEAGLCTFALFHNWGMVLNALGRTEEAIAKYKDAVDHAENDDLSATHNNLGRIYDRLYKDQEALKEFELATSDGSKHTAAAFNNWGNVLRKLRRYNEALEKYYKSIESNPDYAKAYYNKAHLLWQQGKHKESRKAWKEALGVFEKKKASANDTEHFRLCGNIFHEVFQQEDSAEKAYLQALALSGQNIEAIINLVTLYLGQRDEARNAVERNDAQVKADEHSRRARRILEHRLKEALEGRKDDADLRLAEGNLYLTVGSYAEAERAYLKALETLKGSVRAMELQAVFVGLGNLHIQQEDYKKGAEYLEQALEQHADDLLIKSSLAEAYRKLDRIDKAERKYEEIFGISMSHVESYIGRGELYKMMGDGGDVDMYDYAITFFTDALALSKSKDGSKVLKDKELAALLYSRGYASVKLYEATKPAKDEGLLKAALSDFQISYYKDRRNLKAKRACEKLSLRLSYTRSQQALRSIGPPTIFALSLFIFFVTQYLFLTGKAVLWDESTKGLRSIGESSYALLTFGSIIFMIAGLSLPQLLKIKIAGVELEKSSIEQTQLSSNLGISK